MAPALRLLLSENQLRVTVRRLAAEIRRDYADRRPVLLGVLCGAFVFLADLVRELQVPLEVDFIAISSYGAGRVSGGEVRLRGDITANIAGRDVIIVEDIIDSGTSLDFLRKHVEAFGPATVRVCALLVRDGAVDGAAASVDYVGRVIPPGFVVGYGIDCAEDFRYLRDIRVLVETNDG